MSESDAEDCAENLRELIGYLCGQKVIDITGTDWDEVKRGEPNEVELLFEDGSTLTFLVDSGFHWHDARR